MEERAREEAWVVRARVVAALAAVTLTGIGCPPASPPASSVAPSEPSLYVVPSAVRASPAAPSVTPSSMAPAPACAPLAPGELRFFDVAAHTAARFVALAHKVSVVVVGPPREGAACALGCKGLSVRGDAADALAALGFETRRVGSFLLASHVARGEASLPGRGPDIDLDFDRAPSSEIFRLLGDVNRITFEGTSSARATIVVHNEPSLRVANALVSALGGKLEVVGKKARVGALPELAEVAGIDGAPCPEGTRETGAVLGCHEVASLRVLALSRVDGRSEALVSTTTGGVARVARAGDWIGARRVVKDPSVASGERLEPRKIVAITCDGLELDDATRVPPAGSP